MRIVNAHNRHAGAGGMEVLFDAMTNLLRTNGHEVIIVERDNKEMAGLSAKLSAVGSMIHSKSARAEMSSILRDGQVDVVHIHNLYPQLSPSIVEACNQANVPVVMSVQDYKLTCPTAQHLRHGKICEKCLGGAEWNCAIHNCRNSVPMSIAYALRNAVTRWRGTLHEGISAYLCCSRFVAEQTIRGGFPADRVRVLHNFSDLPEAPPKSSPGDYIAFVGRISPEKGIDILIEAARRNRLPVKIAGDASAMPKLQVNLPRNVEFVGRLSRDAMPNFLMNARMLAVPSIWYEAFGIVCAEAMAYRLPVVASDIGGLPEVVDHNLTGLCVEMGHVDAWADALSSLWNDPDRSRSMGEAGRAKALREYSSDVYYERLMAAYRQVAASPVIQRDLSKAQAR